MKKRSLILLCKEIDSKHTNNTPVFDSIVEGGNTGLLVLRNDSLTQQHGIFDAVTSLSFVHGSLYEKLLQKKKDFSRIERKWFNKDPEDKFEGLS